MPKPPREDNSEARKAPVHKLRVFLWNYLKTHPCVDCGENNPIVLQFDHLKPSDTSFSITQYVSDRTVKGLPKTSKRALEPLKKEIAKCEVVCANCHLIRTAASQNFWKARWILNSTDTKYKKIARKLKKVEKKT